MRKMTATALSKMGWRYGLWDEEAGQWDALSIEAGDANLWLEQTKDDNGYKIFNLQTGKEAT